MVGIVGPGPGGEYAAVERACWRPPGADHWRAAGVTVNEVLLEGIDARGAEKLGDAGEREGVVIRIHGVPVRQERACICEGVACGREIANRIIAVQPAP